MPRFEYKVVPAPTKGQKAKGVKTPEGRFAQGIQEILNAEGRAGWEYLRAELLPSDERAGLTGSTTNWRNVLVFRRDLTEAINERPPEIAVSVPEPQTERQPVIVPAPDVAPEPVREPPLVQAPEPVADVRKAENLITVSGMFSAQKSRDDSEAADIDLTDDSPIERS